MSDKLNLSLAALNRLPSYSHLVLEGPDALAFIQAQSMNDIKALVDGQWHWNGLLNPKGRLIALFALIRIRADLLYLLLPDFPAEKLSDHLQRFVFRSKVKLFFNTDKVFAAEFNQVSEFPVPRDFISAGTENTIVLDFSSDTLNRRLWILPMPLSTGVLANVGAEANWRDADLHHGLPRLSAAQTELWTPQMLSLERLNAFSLKIGCYPGQEIVSRTHYLGQAKRQTKLVQAGQLSLEAPIYRNDEKVGELICINLEHNMGLALLQRIDDSDLLTSCQNAVRQSQVLTGLQRPV